VHLEYFGYSDLLQAGGQYNSLRAVFRYADDLINLIPGRKSQHLSLPGVQELIRNAITTGKRKLAQTSGGEDQSGDVVAVDESEKAVFEVTKFLQELLTTHIASTPSASNAYWQDWPMARLRRGPPPLDKWHFFFGLLDCAVQLARYLPPSQIPERLQSVLAQLMLDTGFEGFRGKTVIKIAPVVGGANSDRRLSFSSPVMTPAPSSTIA